VVRISAAALVEEEAPPLRVAAMLGPLVHTLQSTLPDPWKMMVVLGFRGFGDILVGNTWRSK
jgi:hypothetical protein